jgi:uncharacterized oligopeptide transporter (OPT) family protein
MLAIHVTGMPGVAAVLGVAAVVCVACSTSGSLIQDLRAGHLLGGTPWKMQVVEIIAVILLAFFLMWPIIALHQANLKTGGTELPAPPAGLMAQTCEGNCGRRDGLGITRDRRGVRHRHDRLRGAITHADRRRNVSAV